MSYFLKIDGIAGESSTLPYLHWIEVKSFELEPEGIQVSGTSGNAHPKKVAFTAKPRSLFQKLRHAAITGRSIPSVTLAGTSNSSLLLITFTDCIITAIQGDGWSREYLRFSLSCKTVNIQHGHLNSVSNKEFSPAHSVLTQRMP